MANADYSEYRKFLVDFAASVDPTDQLPVRVGGYTLNEGELAGEIMDWTYQYLAEKKCPQTLVTPIVQIILDETKQSCRKTPELCGYNSEVNAYQSLKLMQSVIAKINDVCQRLLDNSQLDMIPAPPPLQEAPPRYAVSAIKNYRRKMEDRHVIIDDFNGVFGIENAERASYYAVFDGHAGVEAATYGVSHLHCHIAASPHYPERPAIAMRDAFMQTDSDFLRKCEKQKLSSGSTALSVLYRPVENRLYVGWLGDSKALLAKQGNITQIVKPHKPDLPSEKKRIEDQGGSVMMYGGMYRVNGSLAVSRAIGDPNHKPFVSGVPDIVSIGLTGCEDFLILGSDGLWDFVTEDDIAFSVYKKVRENPDNLDQVSKILVDLSQIQGSTDNISVIVVFLKDPHQISTSSWPSAVIPSPLDNMETAYDNSNGGATFNNSNEEVFQKSNLLHDLGMDFTDVDREMAQQQQNLNETAAAIAKPVTEHMDFIFGNGSVTLTPTKTATNGKRRASELDDDFGPETDVDTIDEAMLSSTAPTTESFNADVHNQNDYSKFDSSENIQIALTNPFSVHVTSDLSEKLDDFGDQLAARIEDNKFLETVMEDVSDDVQSNKKGIDFSEKKEFSFDREEFEKESDTLEDVKDALNAFAKNELQHVSDMMQDLVPNATAPEYPNDSDHDSFIVPEPDHEPIVDHTAAENVVVPESGEDSEDEWNYIKVKKDENNFTEKLPQEFDGDRAFDDGKDQLNETVAAAVVDTTVGESHAVAQALVESEEACADLLNQNDHNEDDPELLEIESKAAAIDDDDMESQLNPDAKEFVPTSPQHTPTTSPFGNGTPLRNNLLIDNDRLLAQSPRKGEVVMENIEIPTEVDFDNGIANCAMELVDDITAEKEIVSGNAASIAPVSEITTNGDRPGSSSSQYSYQEMNLKEAMHGDEKLEYAPEDNVITPEMAGSEDISGTEPLSDVTESNRNQIDESMAKYLREEDPMNLSFYNDGSAESHNPFAVDLNAVQILPVDDDDEVTVDTTGFDSLVQDPYYIMGQEGQHFVIQDTEFGMNGDAQPAVNDRYAGSPQNDVPDEISKPEEDQYSPVSDTKVVDELLTQSAGGKTESDQPEADLADVINVATSAEPDTPSSIVQVVQEMASEVTSLLNDISLSDRIMSPVDVEPVTATVSPMYEAEHFVESLKETEDDKYNDNRLSPVFNETTLLQQANESLAESDQIVETNTTERFESNVVSTEPSDLQNTTNTVEDVTTEPIIVPVVSAAPFDLATADLGALETTELAVVASTAAVLAATGTAVAIKKASASKATAAKKPEAKAKSATSTATTVKKSTTATSTAATKAKPTSALTTATKAASATTAKSTTGPTPRPRSVPSATATALPKAPTERKVATATAIKKPAMTNGEIKSTSALVSSATSKKISSTLTTSKSATTTSGAAKLSVAAKPSAAASKPAPIRSTLAPKTTSSAPAAKATTLTAASKPATSARAPISRPAFTTTSAAPKPRAAASATKTTTTTTTITRTSPTKTTAPAVTDKLAKETTNKLNATRATTLSTSPRSTTTTTTARKIEAAKSPSARTLSKATSPPLKKLTTPAATSQQLPPPIKKPTSRTSLAPPVPTKRPSSGTSPTSKKRITATKDSNVIASSKTTTTVVTTTTIIEKQMNGDGAGGDLITDVEQITKAANLLSLGAELMENGNESEKIDSTKLNGDRNDGAEPIGDVTHAAIIDFAAD